MMVRFFACIISDPVDDRAIYVEELTDTSMTAWFAPIDPASEAPYYISSDLTDDLIILSDSPLTFTLDGLPPSTPFGIEVNQGDDSYTATERTSKSRWHLIS